MTQNDRVLGIVGNAAIKIPCRVATTSNITLSGEQTIDGVACVSGDRVLVKSQTDGTENGIWDVDTGAWERAKDFDGSYDIVQGTLIPIYRGTGTYQLFGVSIADPVIGTSSLTFETVDDVALTAQLASVASGLGDELVAVKNPATGGVARTQHDKNLDFTTSADLGTLAQAITAASGKTLDLLAGTYNFDPSGGITAITGKIRGAGKRNTIINIVGSGDVFQRGANSVFEDLTIEMNGATYSGHCFKIASGAAAQIDRNVEVTNVASGKQAILFEADGGSGFMSHASAYVSLSTPGVAAAIKVNGTDTNAVPRKFYGTESGGCTLFDFGGAADFFASGFFTNGLIYGATSTKVMLNNVRIGASAGAVTIKGAQHVLSGISAVALVLDTTCTVGIFDIQAPGWDITDNGTGNSVCTNGISYVPTWTGSVSDPVLNNGILKGRYSRQGSLMTIMIDLFMGSGTTYGSGVWFFSLPKLDDATIVQTGGYGLANAAGGVSLAAITAQVQAGLQKVKFLTPAFANIGAAVPGAWAANDTLRVTFQVYCV